MELCLSPAEVPVFASTLLRPHNRLPADRLLDAISCGNLIVLQGDVGQGKTTVLQFVQARVGGILLGMREFMQVLDSREPFAIEEAWLRLMENSLEKHDLVLLDDMHLIAEVVEGYGYPRPNMLDVAITAVLGQAGKNQKLVFAVEERTPAPISRRAQTFQIADFTPADYQSICSAYLGIQADCLDYDRIHRFAPALNAHQLKTAGLRMRSGRRAGHRSIHRVSRLART